ncbi:DNA primase large subunit [Blattella germanica]|nr:DNA primase large subunit [Blattella germanica]
MEYSRRRRLIPEVQSIVTGSLVELYPCDLQLYTLPPTFNISLAEFEEFAQERLTLLRTIDQVNIRGLNKTYDAWKVALIAELKKVGLKGYVKLINGAGCGRTESELQLRKRDHVSHFILRLAYCKSDELRRWFISKELDLFKVRFQSLNAEGIKTFMQVNKLNYESLSLDEKMNLREKLCESSFMVSSAGVENYEFYRVPFTEVKDLVRSRKVYLSGGFAYVPSTDLLSILSSVFRTNLSHGIAMALTKLPYLEGDERVFNLLKDFHQTYTGEEFLANKSSTGNIPIEDLDRLSKCSFPPCMRHLHEHFRANHHLKHGGRLQFSLFLKGIGVSLEDAMRFWREEFTKLTDVDSFEKKYAYSLRHTYGKEGKRANYVPYSCIKIIMSPIGADDAHGCPFRHSELSNLKQKLLSWNISPASVHDITLYVQQGHYQVACGKFFQLSHGANSEIGVNHPNQYFIESQNLMAEGKTGVKVEQGGSTHVENGTPKQKTKIAKKDDLWGDDIDFGCVDVDM